MKISDLKTCAVTDKHKVSELASQRSLMLLFAQLFSHGSRVHFFFLSTAFVFRDDCHPAISCGLYFPVESQGPVFNF